MSGQKRQKWGVMFEKGGKNRTIKNKRPAPVLDCTECSNVLLIYKYILVRGWWGCERTCRDALEQIWFWHFYPKKVRTIEQINVFNDLRQNNQKNNTGTSVQTNTGAGLMFENFLRGRNYRVGVTVPSPRHAGGWSSCPARAGENIFRGLCFSVGFCGILTSGIPPTILKGKTLWTSSLWYLP